MTKGRRIRHQKQKLKTISPIKTNLLFLYCNTHLSECIPPVSHEGLTFFSQKTLTNYFSTCLISDPPLSPPITHNTFIFAASMYNEHATNRSRFEVVVMYAPTGLY